MKRTDKERLESIKEFLIDIFGDTITAEEAKHLAKNVLENKKKLEEFGL